jgi:hypothetical protein
MNFIGNMLTGKDNMTADAARVVGVLGAFAFIVFWCIQVWHTQSFSGPESREYGEGLGLVLLAMAGAIKLNASEEPQPREDRR